MARLNISEQAKDFRRRYGKRAIEVAARIRRLAEANQQWESSDHWSKVILALEGNRPLLRPKRNPTPDVSVRETNMAEYREVAKLYESFTGHKAEPLATVAAPKIPRVAAVIGTLDFVGYTTVRDGEKEAYIHKFKLKDRPVLCAAPDGSIFILGGNYSFTERGIVDESDPLFRKLFSTR